MEIDQDPDPAEAKWGGSKSELVGVTRLSFMNLVDLAGVWVWLWCGWRCVYVYGMCE